MPIDAELLQSLFTLETMPACEVGMELAESFLTACGRAVEQLDAVEPEASRFAFNSRWRDLVEHRRTCEACNEV